MQNIRHSVDFCVVGGGLSGLCAAVAAARAGLKVVLMQDRPILGGNASSEVRMWICGAQGENMLETGLVEQLRLENLYRNPGGNWSIWDSVTYEMARFEPNIELLLNCSCNKLEKEGDRITSVTGWQTTTETWHTVEAPLFADCSGDSVLAPLSDALFRTGREARNEFEESIEPEVADDRTMGMSCLIQARETSKAQCFIPPSWAYKFETDEDLPQRQHDIGKWHTNFWWIELGGEQDTIRDTEKLRDELLKVAFGVWDHIKNHGDHGAANWELEWIGFLPGKRESRRYVGDHILTQNDVQAEGKFADIVAYGGWSMDDHHPAGFKYPGTPTIFHPAPSPYGIPYRCLYSKNIQNLLFAGRNISVTHAAMSSTRVMATCALLGQAVGTAAAVAHKHQVAPRDVYPQYIPELQQLLMDADCYLPWQLREIPRLSQEGELSASEGDPEPLRNGVDRPVDGEDNSWSCSPGGWVQYKWSTQKAVKKVRIVADSNLKRPPWNQPCLYTLNDEVKRPPETLLKLFKIDVRNSDGSWRTISENIVNHQRLITLEEECETDAVRLTVVESWGAPQIRLFAFDVS